MLRRAAPLAVLLLLAALAGCASMSLDRMKTKEGILEETLQTYAATMRWGDMTRCLAFVDPKVRTEHPMSELDLARYKQVSVTAYDDQPATPSGENEVTQTVEIGLVNVNTQSARSVVDRQVWRWDPKDKHWWLMTGLPDITRR
jgi:hypothetical protein